MTFDLLKLSYGSSLFNLLYYFSEIIIFYFILLSLFQSLWCKQQAQYYHHQFFTVNHHLRQHIMSFRIGFFFKLCEQAMDFMIIDNININFM